MRLRLFSPIKFLIENAPGQTFACRYLLIISSADAQLSWLKISVSSDGVGGGSVWHWTRLKLFAAVAAFMTHIRAYSLHLSVIKFVIEQAQFFESSSYMQNISHFAIGQPSYSQSPRWKTINKIWIIASESGASVRISWCTFAVTTSFFKIWPTYELWVSGKQWAGYPPLKYTYLTNIW